MLLASFLLVDLYYYQVWLTWLTFTRVIAKIKRVRF